jgi:excisionase family DNA binding protein
VFKALGAGEDPSTSPRLQDEVCALGLRRDREPQMASDEPLTTGDVAGLCHVSHVTVFRWIKRGLLKAYSTPGGHYRIHRENFLRFLEEQEMPVPESFRNSGPCNVLVVDDDKAVLDVVHRALTLSEAKYRVDRASSGYEACIKIGDKKPHLIILDLIMPGVDGFEVMKVVRSNPETSNCRILVLSGFSSQENIRKAKKNGADMFLNKPIDVEVLLGKIGELLET